MNHIHLTEADVLIMREAIEELIELTYCSAPSLDIVEQAREGAREALKRLDGETV